MLVIYLKETDYDTKVGEIEKKIPHHNKYIIINQFNKFSGAIFDERLKTQNQQQLMILILLNKLLPQMSKNQKNFKHMIQVFLLVKVTLAMVNPKIS